MNNTRTIVSALHPRRYQDSFTEIYMLVWFEEFDGPLEFCASPFDCERHGKELWIRAMAGEYGEIEVIDKESPLASSRGDLLPIDEQRSLLTHSGDAR